MLARHAHGSLLGGAPLRRAAWRPFAATAAAPPHCRRQRLPLRPGRAAMRPSAALAEDSADGETEDSQLLRIAAQSGGKVTKTAVGKLGVAELREECQRLKLPSEGLKAALVERLMGWWEQQQQQQAQAGSGAAAHAEQPASASSSAGSSSSSSTSAPHEQAAAAAAAAVPARVAAADVAAASAATSTVAAAVSKGASSTGASIGQQPPQQQQQRQRMQPGGPVSVTWLGTSSGNPTPRRNVSAIAVKFGHDLFMVDCGEGTHNQLRRTKLQPDQLRAIFVTHMHGDHCFGVPGVLSAVLQARQGTPLQGEPIHIYGPPELQSLVLAAVRAGGLVLTTPVVVTGFVLDPQRARAPTKVDESGMLQMALQGPDQAERVPTQLAKAWQAAYDQGSEDIVQPGLTWTVRVPGGPLVAAAQLQHRVPCWGYVFQEPPAVVPPPHSHNHRAAENKRAAAAAGAPDGAAAGEGSAAAAAVADKQQEEQWVQRGRKLVILGDTCDSTAIAPLALGCDLLSHEATFCSGMEDKAVIAQHSTTLQAGAFAAAVDAQRLVLTHFSARYESAASNVTGMRRQPGGRSGGRGGRGGGSQGAAGVEPTDLMRSDLMRLLDETHSTYGKDTLDLAHDFFTVDVPLPPPMPVGQLQQLQARQAAAATQRQQQGTGQQQQRYNNREQRYNDRGAGGGRGYQQQYQQQRPGGGRGRGQYQQRRPGGGRGGQYQQQYQQRRSGAGQYQSYDE